MGIAVWRSVSVTTSTDGLSNLIQTGGLTLSSIQMSTAWTAAAVTFKGSVNGSTVLGDLFTSTGGELSFTSTASNVVTFDPYPFIGIDAIQIRSGATGAPVAQAATRVLTLGFSRTNP